MSSHKSPNILVIVCDDARIATLSCYGLGVLGSGVPDVGRLAREGMLFTNTNAGQYHAGSRPPSSVWTGVEDPTIATLPQGHGYACGRFGRSHARDLNQELPAVRGFDEFFGLLSRRDMTQEPQDPEYPPGEAMQDVVHSWAADEETIVRHCGPMKPERMRSFDYEVLESSLAFIERALGQGRPFFVWHSTTQTRRHTPMNSEVRGQAHPLLPGYHDKMVEHDRQMGVLLDKLDELRVTSDTVVVYTSDQRPHQITDARPASTPARPENDGSGQGISGAPMLVRWPGVIEPGSICTEVVNLQEWLPALVRVAVEPSVLHSSTIVSGPRSKPKGRGRYVSARKSP